VDAHAEQGAVARRHLGAAAQVDMADDVAGGADGQPQAAPVRLPTSMSSPFRKEMRTPLGKRDSPRDIGWNSGPPSAPL
jgi:hypothetical protein